MPRAKYRHQEKYGGVKIDLSADTERELAEKVRARKNDIDKGLVGGNKITVALWCEIWLKEYKKPFVTAKTYGLYSGFVNNHIIPVIGKRYLTDVKPIDLQKILTSKTGMSFSFVSKLRACLNQIFSQARINGYIMSDPSDYLKLPPANKGSHRAITEEETRVLFEVADNTKYGAYIYLLYYCGLRPQEAIALNWSDVDFDKGLLHVSKAVENGSKTIKAPKTAAGVRDIPMPDKLIKFLEPLKGEPDAPVLLTDSGKRGDYCSLFYWWKQIRREMNIRMGAKVYRNQVVDSLVAKDFTAYCLRHSYCTNLQRAGVPLNVAKYLMGHSDIKMTADIYGHQTDDQTENARNLMNILYKKGT